MDRSSLSHAFAAVCLLCLPMSSAKGSVSELLTQGSVSAARAQNRTATQQSDSGQRLAHGLYVIDSMSCSEVSWDYEASYTPPAFIVDGENDAGNEYISVLGPSSAAVEDEVDEGDDGLLRFRLCPPDQLGPDVVTWPENRPVSALPIDTGVYQTFVGDRPVEDDQLCGGVSEYMLFEPTRFAALVQEWCASERSSDVSSFGMLHQANDRVFWPESGFPLRVIAPDRFEWSMLECGTYEFRRVDPASVPAGLLPRW